MSNTRSLRSRYSSPATFTPVSQEGVSAVQDTIEVPQSEHGVENQSRLDHWVEPSIQHGVASFEDTKGLERVGVLEHMQPLGIAPNQKLLQRLKIHFPRQSLSARATPVYSEGVASPVAESAPVREEIASPIMIDPELLIDPPLPVQSSYRPPASEHPSQVQSHPASVPSPPVQYPAPQQHPVAMSPPRGRPAKREVEEMRVYPDENMVSPIDTASRPARASPRNPSIQEHQKGERYRGFLQNAINRAGREGKHDVASGLLKVLNESDRDEVITALENITKYKSGVRLEQFKVFKYYIKKGIRKHRRASSRISTFDNDSGLPPPMPQSQKPVAYVSSFHANIKRPPPVDPAPTSNNAVKSPLTFRTSLPQTSHNASPPRLILRSPSFVRNPATRHFGRMSDDPLPESPPGLVSRKRRSSDTSSLSSAVSIPSSLLGPPPAGFTAPDLGNFDQAAEGPAVRSAVSRQAPTRAATSRATRVSGRDHHIEQSHLELQSFKFLNTTNKDAQTKRLKIPALAVDFDNTEERERLLQFERQSEQNYNYRDVPFSDMRSDVESTRSDDMLDHRTKLHTGPPPPTIHPNSLVHAVVFVSSPATTEFPPTVNGTSRKRNYDDFASDGLSSRLSSPELSVSSDAYAQAPPINIRLNIRESSTRASTPRTVKDGSQTNGRKKARTMVSHSPKKSKIGANNPGETRAGVSKEAASTNGVDANGEEPENEDECRVCGDEGLLLLCEGCPNSFHGDCLEPPINTDEVEGDWYCPECAAKRRPEAVRSEGFMSALLDQINDAFPRSYLLPQDIRDYFENVKTGEDGLYIEVPPPPTNKKGAPRTDNNGAMKPPNYRDLRDRYGHLRLCYKCGHTTDGDKEMMPCDYCPHEWHLDCLDPPAAVVPKRFGNDGKVPQPWRCPLHINQDLLEYGRAPGVEPGQLGRRPRLRRPKNAVSTMRTGSKPAVTNNGIIDVVLEPEETLDIKIQDKGGIVERLPEKQIILNFIAKARYEFYNETTIKRSRNILSHQTRAKSWLPDNPTFRDRPAPLLADDEESDAMDQTIRAREEAQLRLAQKSFPEKRTIHHLLDLAVHNAGNAGMSSYEYADIHNLVNRLTADAPESVVDQVVESEMDELDKLEELIRQRKAVLRGSTGDAKEKARPPSSEKSKITETANLNGIIWHGHGM